MKMIIPNRLWVGAFIPNWLLKQSSISANCKLVYASMCQNSTDYGVVFVKQEQIASQVGMTLRTIQRTLADLEEFKLIDKKQVGMSQPNEYRFPHHEWMNELELTTDVKIKEPKQKQETTNGTRGTRIQKDWEPTTETREWAVSLIGEDGIKWQVDKYKNYWLSKSGTRAVKACWQRTFRSWIQNEIEWNNVTPVSGYKSSGSKKDFVRGSGAREDRRSGLRDALDKRLAAL
jgi:hypothetical protein|tara:strand:- start:1304 stop:1999 length:696 start_codon:yes stop_codon:yes gene_type:complete